MTRQTQDEEFDVVVLGCGSGGEVVAPELAAAGQRVAVVERGLLGGECPYFACIPSKVLLHDAAAGREWSTAIRRRSEATEHLDDTGTARRLADDGVTIVRGHGRITGPGQLLVDDRTLRWRVLIVNTGSAPSAPAIDGLTDVPTWTSDEALTSEERPDRLIVLGGGPVGCELAQVYARFGTIVTLIEPAERLNASEAPFVGEQLAAALTADGVDLRLGVEPSGAKPINGCVRIELGDAQAVDADRVLIATGRKPVVEDIGLETLGVDVEAAATGLPIDDFCRVRGVPNVWAIGDVTGVAPYTHTANYQARVVGDNLQGRSHAADYRAIPRAVYTDPGAYAVGLTPEQARDRGVDLATADFDLTETARSLIEGGAGGRVELYADRARGELIGAAAVGPHVDSWLAEATLAIRARIPVRVYADVVHAFPTWGEAVEPALRRLAADCTGV